MIALTYLLYVLIWPVGLVVGTSYVVFILGHSGWWFVLTAFLLSDTYSPGSWSTLATKWGIKK